MGLMFPRVALNFVKNGYYPTDEATLEALLQKLRADESGDLRVFDPCCGEGVALAEIKHHLGVDRTEAFGIELEARRARHAEDLLDRVIHADVQRCKWTRRAFGLLVLNPPYGDTVRSNAGLGTKREKRLEEIFLNVTLPSLAFGGVMVLLLPHHAYTEATERRLHANFSGLRVYRAIDRQFKQLVIVGRKKRTSDPNDSVPLRRDPSGGVLEPEELVPSIDEADEALFTVPSVREPLREFFTFMVTEGALRSEIEKFPCLWGDFAATFRAHRTVPKRPLRALSPWHLSLALAAGNINGVIESEAGRRLLVKGDTFKVQKVDTTEDAEGKTVTKLDRFVPTIKAIDLTEGSPEYGKVLTIA